MHSMKEHIKCELLNKFGSIFPLTLAIVPYETLHIEQCDHFLHFKCHDLLYRQT